MTFSARSTVKLKVFDVINDTSRNSSVDIFRSIAIISVVVYHFGLLPFGSLGVDLFFVISGLLVGGQLTKDMTKGRKISFLKFFLQRGFKIWPSFYAFMMIGTVFAWCFYHNSRPNQVIPLWDMKRYLLFYQNYTGFPLYWSFNHIWSLCVEEHFYILLPIMFLFIQSLISDQYKIKSLYVFVIITIISGIVFKNCSYYFMNSKDTYSATHNRVDALAWGVLLNLIITNYSDRIKSGYNQSIAFLSGLLLFVLSIYIFKSYGNIIFNGVYFHAVVPFAFFLMLLGTYYVNFSRLKLMRFIAYYSYNWYLWHPVFVYYIKDNIGFNTTGFIFYMVVTFSMAFIATIYIEEPFLEKRKLIIAKIVKS